MTQHAATIVGFDRLLTEHWLMAPNKVRALLTSVRAIIVGGQVRADMLGSSPDATNPGYEVLAGGVAVINIKGVMVKDANWLTQFMGWNTSTQIMAALDGALADPSVLRIAFVIDTPGGSLRGTGELAAAVAAAKKTKPIFALVSDLCASAGYWVASQCNVISANATAMVGCIGVYSVLTDESKFQEAMGLKDTLISSGGVKGLGADGKVTAELISDTQREINAAGEMFIQAVATGRGMSTETARALADGRSWPPAEAKAKGLIDMIIEVNVGLANLSSHPAPRTSSTQQGSTSPTGQSNMSNATESVAQAAWNAMSDDERGGWLDFETFAAYHKRAVLGGINYSGNDRSNSGARPPAPSPSLTSPAPAPLAAATGAAADVARSEWDAMPLHKQGEWRCDGEAYVAARVQVEGEWARADKSAWISKAVFVQARMCQLRQVR
jgi:signal peptide peptidase SppA